MMSKNMRDRRYEGFEQRELELAEERSFHNPKTWYTERRDHDYNCGIMDVHESIRKHGDVLNVSRDVKHDTRYYDYRPTVRQVNRRVNSIFKIAIPWDTVIGSSKHHQLMRTIATNILDPQVSLCTKRLTDWVTSIISDTRKLCTKEERDWFIQSALKIQESANADLQKKFERYVADLCALKIGGLNQFFDQDENSNYTYSVDHVAETRFSPYRNIFLDPTVVQLLEKLERHIKYRTSNDAKRYAKTEVLKYQRVFTRKLDYYAMCDEDTMHFKNTSIKNNTAITIFRIGSFYTAYKHWVYLKQLENHIDMIYDGQYDFGYNGDINTAIEYCAAKYKFDGNTPVTIRVQWERGFEPGVLCGLLYTCNEKLNEVVQCINRSKHLHQFYTYMVSTNRLMQSDTRDAYNDEIISDIENIVSKYKKDKYHNADVHNNPIIVKAVTNADIELINAQICELRQSCDRLHMMIGDQSTLTIMHQTAYDTFRVFSASNLDNLCSRIHRDHFIDDLQDVINVVRQECAGNPGFSVTVSVFELLTYLEYIWQNQDNISSFKIDKFRFAMNDESIMNAFNTVQSIINNRWLHPAYTEHEVVILFEKNISNKFPPYFDTNKCII